MPDQDVTEATTATVPEESGEAYEANPEAIDPPVVEETTSEAADAPEADADASDDEDEEQGQNELVVLDDLGGL